VHGCGVFGGPATVICFFDKCTALAAGDSEILHDCQKTTDN
jgi:hypothetical protein